MPSGAQPPYVIEPLDSSKHRREAFDCGVEDLNRYLKQQAGQDMRRRVTGCWILSTPDHPSTILGYYTLSTESVLTAEAGETLAKAVKKLPRYPRLGAILLGRLAVSKGHQNQGLGKKLLLDALFRCALSEIPAPLILVDAKNSEAEAFYLRYGFEKLTGRRFFLPMHALQAGLGSSG